jgi:hypothetical protein
VAPRDDRDGRCGEETPTVAGAVRDGGSSATYRAGMRLFSLLRWWKRGPDGPPVYHRLICGATRSGKSESALVTLVRLARRNGRAIVLMDPPGTLAAKFLLHLDALGLTSRVLYDRLSDTDRVPGYEWLVPSNHPDLLQRQAENDERIREFASVLLRRRGIQDAATRPLIEEAVLAALRLFVQQKASVPLPWLADAFTPGTPARAQLLANCTDPAVVRKFHEYGSLSPTARRAETGPAERILRAVLESPAFRVRSGGATFDLDRFLNEQGILILDGSSRGNLSRDAASVMMGAVTLRVIAHCRTRAAARVVLVLDEAVNAGLIGLYESQALAEAAKWGLEFHILVQDPLSFPTAEIRSNVLQNCWRHEWFRQGSPEAARLAAEDIAIPLLDPLKHHHTEYRVRSAEAGYERVAVTSTSERFDPDGGEVGRSTTWSTVLWPRRREVKEAQERFTALADQVLLTQKELMRLRPGYCFVRGDAVTTAPTYVPMLRLPRPRGGTCQRRRLVSPKAQDPESEFVRVLGMLKRRELYHPPAGGACSPRAASSPAAAAWRLAQRTEGTTAGGSPGGQTEPRPGRHP